MNKPKWEDAPGWARWLAKDMNGAWHWYEFKPERYCGFWGRQLDDNDAGLGRQQIAGAADVNWSKSLECRPEEELMTSEEVDWRAEAEAQRERADDAERQLGRALR